MTDIVDDLKAGLSQKLINEKWLKGHTPFLLPSDITKLANKFASIDDLAELEPELYASYFGKPTKAA